MQLMLESCLVSAGTNTALALGMAVSHTGCSYARQEDSLCIRSLLAQPLVSRLRKDLRTAHGELRLKQLFCPSAIGMVMLNYPLLKLAQ